MKNHFFPAPLVLNLLQWILNDLVNVANFSLSCSLPRPEQSSADLGCAGLQLPSSSGEQAAQRRHFIRTTRRASSQAAKDGGRGRDRVCSASSHTCTAACHCCNDITNPWPKAIKSRASQQASSGEPLLSSQCFNFYTSLIWLADIT